MDYEMEELLPVVSELMQNYSGYESTSVTYEKAQQFMEAVIYCLNEYNSLNKNRMLCKEISVKKQYDIGLNLILEKIENIRNIYNKISFQFENFGVKCLYDTVQRGIPQFLKWYDVRFCPQNTILTLDYPLLFDCSTLKGADAIYQYIQAIQLEQIFLGAFEKYYVISVLERYDCEYQDMIENICSVVLTDIICHFAIQKPISDFPFSYHEFVQLSKVFDDKEVSDIEEMIKELTGKMVNQLFGNQRELIDYLSMEANNIALRIYTANQYGQLSSILSIEI